MNTDYSVKSNWLKSAGIVVALFIMVIATIAGCTRISSNEVDSIISLDVNPSLEIKVNKEEKVIEVTPLNTRAQTVIGTMDFKDTDLEVAVNALIGSMLKNGYITGDLNSILISVESEDEVKGAELQARLGKEIDKLLRASSIEGAIVSQVVLKDDNLKSLADEYDITRGKAQVIQQLIQEDDHYKFKDLAKLSVNELNLLVRSKHLELANSSAVGRASDKSYIGSMKAVEIAIEHAGLNSAAVKELEVELEYDDGKIIYEVEFYANGKEYEYEVDALTGEVLYPVRDTKQIQNEKTGTVTAPPKSETDTATTPPKDDLATKEQIETSRMSASAARKAVLDKFGEGIIQKIEYNYDEKNPLYKGEALKKGSRVVFELNARTHAFKKWDLDHDDDSWDEFSHALSNMITMEQAANNVINKSGKSNTFVQKIDFLWEDSEPMYQGEAFNRGFKYSFEIYAYGGDFEKWDPDSDDDTWAEKYYNVK